MDEYAAASRTDKRIALDRLARARSNGAIDARDYRMRRELARKSRSVGELQTLLMDVPDDQDNRDHWRFGHWRGPVKEGRELEIQRVVGAVFLGLALLVVAACVYAVIALYEHWH